MFTSNAAHYTVPLRGLGRLREEVEPSETTPTSPDGAVAKPLANGLVGVGFTSWYRLQHRAGF